MALLPAEHPFVGVAILPSNDSLGEQQTRNEKYCAAINEDLFVITFM